MVKFSVSYRLLPPPCLLSVPEVGHNVSQENPSAAVPGIHLSPAKTFPAFLWLLCKKGRSNETTPSSCFCLFLWHKQLWRQFLFAHQKFHRGRIFQLMVSLLLNSVTGSYVLRTPSVCKEATATSVLSPTYCLQKKKRFISA